MGSAYIRLNNKFILRLGKKYFLTTISKVSEWKGLTATQKENHMGKDVTTQIKGLLKKHGSKSNMNFKTHPSKKKIRKAVRRSVRRSGRKRRTSKRIGGSSKGGSSKGS